MNNFEEPLQLKEQEVIHENERGTIVSNNNSSKRTEMEVVPKVPIPIAEESWLEDATYWDEEIRRNPLLFPTVLPILFSHMDGKTLKEARQVCHLWKEFIGPVFKKKMEAYVELVSLCTPGCNHQEENDKICLRFLNTLEGVENNELPFDHLCINVMDMCCEERMSQIFATYGSRIHYLELIFDDCHFTAEHLKQILLNWFPNLKTLRLSNIPFEVAWSSEEMFHVEQGIDQPKNISRAPICAITELTFFDETSNFPLEKLMIYHLMAVCPHLTQIEVDLEDGDALGAFLGGMVMAKGVGCLKNLNTFIIGRESNSGRLLDSLYGRRICCSFDEKHLVSLREMELGQLMRLEIYNVGKDISVNNLYALFRQLSNSLETLSLNMDVEMAQKAKHDSKILFFPKMKNLKNLEIKSGKIQISDDIDIVSHFPNLKTCILDADCKNCIGCIGNGIYNVYRNTLTLKCKQDLDLPLARNSKPIQVSYKPYCLDSFRGIGKQFPTLKSVWADIREDGLGIVDLFSDMDEVNKAVGDRLVFVDLFAALSKTNVEELQVEVHCQQLRGTLCCLNESLEVEEREVKKLLDRGSKMVDANVVTTKVGRECEEAFPELRKLKIVSNGCHKMNIDVLRELGVLNLVKNAPELSHFAIKYRFETSSQTCVVFSQQKCGNQEFHDMSEECQYQGSPNAM